MPRVGVAQKVYSWAVLLLPIMALYKSPISSVDLGTFLCLPIILMCALFSNDQGINSILYNSKSSKRQICSYIWLCAYMFIIVGINVVFPIYQLFSNKEQMIFRYLKLVVSSSIILISGQRLMAFSHFIKCYRFIVYSAMIYIVLQTIVFYANKKVLAPFVVDYITEDYSYILNYEYHQQLGLFRPMSFFYEPAHYCEYCIPYVVYVFFGENSRLNGVTVEMICVSIGIVLSTSGIGIGVLGFSWLVYLMLYYKEQRKASIILVVFVLLAGALVMVSYVPMAKAAVERLISFKGGEGAAQIRFTAGYPVFKEMNLFGKIFGIGYGNYPPGYAISLSYSLISNGIVGTIVLLSFIVTLYRNSEVRYSRALTIVLTGMMFVTMIFNTGFTLYLPCIIYATTAKTLKTNNERNMASIIYNDKNRRVLKWIT